MASMHEEAETSIVKSDRIGRTQYSREYKAKVLAAFEQSGMSAAGFAKQCGIKYPTFVSWVAKARKKHGQATTPRSPKKSPASPAFLVAELPAPTDSPTLQIELPGGATLKVTDQKQLPLVASLLQSLR